MAKRYRSTQWWLKRREQIIFLVFLAIFFIVNPRHEKNGVVAAITDLVPAKKEVLPVINPAPYPMNITGNQPETITAHGIYIIDMLSGVPLYARNELEPMAPASTTKLMTALVSLDLYTLDDIVTIPSATVAGQIMELTPGEKISVENLLYGLLIESGNDAAEALAAHHPFGTAGFVAAMNAKARDLNLEQTTFTNSSGLDADGHRMSSKDLARLSRIAIENPIIAKIVAIPQITIHDVDYKLFHTLKTTNLLLGKIPGVAGIKTGLTENAGECLVTLVERDGHKVILVVLKSKDRFTDTTKLIDWVFASHQWMKYGL
jgi:serine-type D-Ala-D-Ala carboxypeptidase (penicillin-binding protein 5/6)